MIDPYEGKTRSEYLAGLSEEYEISEDNVIFWSQILGPEEDFDLLITVLETASERQG